MENKYYTPSLGELYDGFELESNYVLWSNDKTWKKITINLKENPYFIDSYLADAYPTEFRVKHLDREDIESLGFVLEVVECGEGTEYDELGIRRNNSSSYVGKFFLDAAVEIYNANIEIYGVCFNIRNKSELKRLLTQVGITN